MSAVSEKYLPEEAALIQKLGENQKKIGKKDELIRAYDAEVEEAVARLRRKHGIGAVQAERSRLDAERVSLERAMFKTRCRLVVGTIDLLLRAMPGRKAVLAEELGTKVSSLKLSQAETGDVPYEEAYHSFALDVMNDDKFDGLDCDETSDKYVWLEDGTVGTGIPRTLLSGKAIDGFLAWADVRLAELSRAWAEDWVAGAAMDREKRKALMAALAAMDV